MSMKASWVEVVGTAAASVILASASLLTCGSASADVGALARFLRAMEPRIAKLGTRQADEFAADSRSVLRSADAKASQDDEEFTRIIDGACTINRLQRRAQSTDDFLRSYFPVYERQAVWAQAEAYRGWQSWNDNGSQYVDIVCDEVRRHPRL